MDCGVCVISSLSRGRVIIRLDVFNFYDNIQIQYITSVLMMAREVLRKGHQREITDTHQLGKIQFKKITRSINLRSRVSS